METPKDKAVELCVKFFKPSVFKYEEKQYAVDEESAKQCALICVDNEIQLIALLVGRSLLTVEKGSDLINELKEVKKEIETYER